MEGEEVRGREGGTWKGRRYMEGKEVHGREGGTWKGRRYVEGEEVRGRRGTFSTAIENGPPPRINNVTTARGRGSCTYYNQWVNK